jgi:hypothetical protein
MTEPAERAPATLQVDPGGYTRIPVALTFPSVVEMGGKHTPQHTYRTVAMHSVPRRGETIRIDDGCVWTVVLVDWHTACVHCQIAPVCHVAAALYDAHYGLDNAPPKQSKKQKRAKR